MYLKHGDTALFATCNFMIRKILPSKMLKIAFLAKIYTVPIFLVRLAYPSEAGNRASI